MLIFIKADEHYIEKMLKNVYVCVTCTTSMIGCGPPP